MQKLLVQLILGAVALVGLASCGPHKPRSKCSGRANAVSDLQVLQPYNMQGISTCARVVVWCAFHAVAAGKQVVFLPVDLTRAAGTSVTQTVSVGGGATPY